MPTTPDDFAYFVAGEPETTLSGKTATTGFDYFVAAEPIVGLVPGGGTAQALAGTTGGTATTSGALKVSHTLAGTSSGVATASGTLKVAHTLAGASAGLGGDTSTLEVARPLAGSTNGTGSASGSLSGGSVPGSAGTPSQSGVGYWRGSAPVHRGRTVTRLHLISSSRHRLLYSHRSRHTISAAARSAIHTRTTTSRRLATTQRAVAHASVTTAATVASEHRALIWTVEDRRRDDEHAAYLLAIRLRR